MLREVKNGELVRSHLGIGGWRWRFVQGERASSATWSTRAVREIAAAQATEPVALMGQGERIYWAFEDRYFWEADGLQARDVLALIRDRERRARRRLERAHAGLAQDAAEPAMRRDHVAREVQIGRAHV